jgi:hypothetical protein
MQTRNPTSGAVLDSLPPVLWAFVPLADYKVPEVPARSAAASAWKSFKQIFMPQDADLQAPVKKEADLRALSQMRLQNLLRPLEWYDAAAALDRAVKEWMTATVRRSVRFVVGQPHGGHAEILGAWAERNQAVPIIAPTPEQIFAGDHLWFDNWPQDGRPWVLPNLEHCYLRHAKGLELIRHLLLQADRGSLGRGVIGCDSWAWAYLQRIWPVGRPDALTLQAFDGPRLKDMIRHLAVCPPGRRLCFRNAADGHDILLLPDAQDSVPSEIVQLAALCRGNLGIALASWRERLRSEPDSEGAEPAGSSPSASTGEPGEQSVWVSSAMPEPVLPAGMNEESALILHALLLHGGLSEALLTELLPLSDALCGAVLGRLAHAGFLECQKDRWGVSALAYAATRNLLRRGEYLTDGF